MSALDVSAVWLLRLPAVFGGFEREILEALAAVVVRKPAAELRLVRMPGPWRWDDPMVAKYVPWKLPVHHSWPCDPHAVDGFIEKAARALQRKFADAEPQTVMVGALEAGGTDHRFRRLASNLRGRTLQLFPASCAAIRAAEDQDPRRMTLFCHVGDDGLFCGLQSPALAGGFHPGGTKFIRQADAISRAGAKAAEALHHLRLHQAAPPPGNRWLELGASPGGMTAELLARGYRVTAVDRAPLDPRLAGAAGLQAVCCDVAKFRPPPGTNYDAILCDLNGNPLESFGQALRLARHLVAGGLVVFTVKLAGVATFEETNRLVDELLRRSQAAGLRFVSLHHLSYNRREFTLFCQARRAI